MAQKFAHHTNCTQTAFTFAFDSSRYGSCRLRYPLLSIPNSVRDRGRRQVNGFAYGGESKRNVAPLIPFHPAKVGVVDIVVKGKSHSARPIVAGDIGDFDMQALENDTLSPMHGYVGVSI